jgi:hypothetical protein
MGELPAFVSGRRNVAEATPPSPPVTVTEGIQSPPARPKRFSSASNDWKRVSSIPRRDASVGKSFDCKHPCHTDDASVTAGMSAGGFLGGAGAAFFLLAAVVCAEAVGCGFFVFAVAFDFARFFGGVVFAGGFAGAARAWGDSVTVHNSTKPAV